MMTIGGPGPAGSRSNTPREIQTALRQIGDEAAALIMSIRGTDLDVREKTSNIDLQTRADRASQELILARLSRAFPDAGLVGEEDTDVAAVVQKLEKDFFFTVDPLDGTFNFVDGGLDWGVVIGMFRGGRPCAGVIVQPLRETRFEYTYGGETLLNGAPPKPVEPPQRVSLSIGARNPTFYHDVLFPELERAGYELMRAPCAIAAQLAVVRGEACAYLALGEKVWDVGGIVAFFEQRGGLVGVHAAPVPFRAIAQEPFVGALEYGPARTLADLLARIGFDRGKLLP